MSESISDADYEVVETQIVAMGRLVQGVDLAGYVERAESALNHGAIFCPSEWIRGHEELEKRLRLARALLDFQAAVESMRPVLGAGEGSDMTAESAKGTEKGLLRDEG